MSELFCEEIAHKSGFPISVGNWIAPDGSLISGTDYNTHHQETLISYLGYEPQTDNILTWMNEKVSEGFIRLVFRNDVLFQVGCKEKEEIWAESPNIIVMRSILAKIPEVEIHIFSKTFYIIGLARNVLEQRWQKLQIQEAS